MRLIAFTLLCAWLSAWVGHAQDYPSARIANGELTVDLYLPDQEKGSYRGTRFDRSGIIRSLMYKGHNYFGKWYDTHDPLFHDAITGPVNIFDNAGPATGYAEAKPGETFVRIGVGRVEKPEEPAYKELHTYKVVDPGKWTIQKRKDSIEFTHELPDMGAQTGYGYIYSKKLSLVPGKPEMILAQELKNTGSKPIDTMVFNHGFFQIDREPAGPGLVWTFPFKPTTKRYMADVAEIRGDKIVYLREIIPGERLLAPLEGYGTSAKDHRFSLENRKTGAGVRVSGDRPIAKLTFWSRRMAYSPEASVHLRVLPGQTEKWETRYEFYLAPERKKCLCDING